jgi:hypothetical protein
MLRTLPQRINKIIRIRISKISKINNFPIDIIIKNIWKINK